MSTRQLKEAEVIEGVENSNCDIIEARLEIITLRIMNRNGAEK